jgi:branched-chain amino acid transport system ATP-binding protein
MLRVEGLSKNYGGLAVLRSLSFSIEPREKVALIGPNGAGKTTMLNIVSGLVRPTSGRIYFLDYA